MQDSVFFYNSPLGFLEIQLRSNQIYSISKKNISYSRIKKQDLVEMKKWWGSRRSVSYSVFRRKNTGLRVFFKADLSQIERSKKTRELIQKTVVFLDSYFSSKEVQKRNLPLFPRGTVFQRKVWRYLQKIPCGRTDTYAKVAKKVNSPGAARAVGSACAQNPYLILVPCHRVVAQKGLGGFALGLSKKKWLLHHEKNLMNKLEISL